MTEPTAALDGRHDASEIDEPAPTAAAGDRSEPAPTAAAGETTERAPAGASGDTTERAPAVGRDQTAEAPPTAAPGVTGEPAPTAVSGGPTDAATEPTAPDRPRARRVVGPAPAAADLRVAHVLLRVGNALPARVHLETLAGRRQLDVQGLLDLGESRWRTGDLAGAGEAALAYLESGGEAPLGFVIAAEAAAAVGRPGEARKLARRALEALDEPLDAVFAGQPRSGIWPHDPAAPAQPAGTLFAPQPTSAARGGRIGLTSDPRHDPSPGAARPGVTSAATSSAPLALPEGAGATAAPSAASPGAPAETVEPITSAEVQPDRSIWDAGTPPPDAQRELDAARSALEEGDPRAAAVRLGIALRMSPTLAPVVLDLVGQLPGPDFDLLRGDALRLVGHEAAAERAFAAAAEALRGPTPSPRSSE